MPSPVPHRTARPGAALLRERPRSAPRPQQAAQGWGAAPRCFALPFPSFPSLCSAPAAGRVRRSRGAPPCPALPCAALLAEEPAGRRGGRGAGCCLWGEGWLCAENTRETHPNAQLSPSHLSQRSTSDRHTAVAITGLRRLVLVTVLWVFSLLTHPKCFLLSGATAGLGLDTSGAAWAQHKMSLLVEGAAP